MYESAANGFMHKGAEKHQESSVLELKPCCVCLLRENVQSDTNLFQITLPLRILALN